MFRFDRRWKEAELFPRVLHCAIDADPVPSRPKATGCEQRIGLEPRFNVKGGQKCPGYGCLVRAEALRVSITLAPPRARFGLHPTSNGSFVVNVLPAESLL